MKKGITIIILLITIIVIAILSATVVITSKTSVNKSNLANFTQNMSKIEDAVITYYATRGVLPVKANTSKITKADVLAIVNENYTDTFQEQLEANGDGDSNFYYLDIEKIGVEKVTVDFSLEQDDWIINEEGTHIYYTEGFKIGAQMYFTVTGSMK